MKSKLNHAYSIICGLLLLSAVMPAHALDFGAWGKKSEITFSGYTGTETLINFPALVVLGSNSIPGFNYADCLPDGADLRFSDSTGMVELPYEIDTWNSDGDSYVWVQVPELEGQGSSIWAYWGNAAAEAPEYTTNGTVWANGYVGVWHLDEPNPADSTQYKNDGIQNQNTDVPGVIGGSQNFNGSTTRINCGNDASLELSGELTIEGWVKPNTLSGIQAVIAKHGLIYFGLNSSGMRFTTLTVKDHDSGPAGFTVGEWGYMAVSFTPSTANGCRFYRDGELISSVLSSAQRGGIQTFYIGAREAGVFFNGAIDELRVSTVSRSADWLQASYKTVGENSSFQTYGEAQSAVPGMPFIQIGSATNITTSAAWLCGNLISTGSTDTAVTAYWGSTDGKETAANWDDSASLSAPQSSGKFSVLASGLLPDATYYYRVAASNEAGVSWSFDAGCFITGELILTKTADADEASLSSGVFTVTRPSSAANENLVVQYGQTGGTAVSGQDYAALPGAVTIAAGETSAEITVTPLKNYLLLENTTLELTLTDAQAIIGGSDSATITIINEDMPSAPTNVWIRSGADALASTDANWSLGHAPTNTDAIIYLGSYATSPNMTWDVTNAVATWLQPAGYTGTVTVLTKYPGQGGFTNMVVTGNVVLDGGVWTHPANTGDTIEKDRLAVSVGGNFYMGPQGNIDLTGRGYADQRGPGAGNNIQRFNNSGKGASYGGRGGHGSETSPGPCYGSAVAPLALGSGARTSGGGALSLMVAGHAAINGTVKANGSYYNSLNSGAAGGSIYVRSGTVSGTGLLQASGGDGYWSGGGGRIAVIATSGTAADGILCEALPGTPYGWRGTAGTIYREGLVGGNRKGVLTIDQQNLPPMTGASTELPPAYELDKYAENPVVGGELEDVTLVMTNGARVALTSSLRMGDFAYLGSGSTIDLAGSFLYLKAPEPAGAFPADYGNGTVSYNGGDIIWGDAPAETVLVTTSGPNGSVATYPLNENGIYPLGTLVTVTAIPDSGYTFIEWEGDYPYAGDPTNNPVNIVMNDRQELRAIFASTAPNTKTWIGRGSDYLASNNENWYPSTTPVSGDNIIFDATNTKECQWDLDVELASWTQDDGYSYNYDAVAKKYFGLVTFKTRYPGQGSFTNMNITGDVVIGDGVWTHPVNTGVDVAVDRLAVSVGGDFTLASKASIDVNGRGYAAIKGPGAGAFGQRSVSYSNARAASHGGRGADVFSGTNNVPPCYGSPSHPEALGSGASYGGGGAVKLQVAGEAVVDGTVLARGADSSQHAVGSGGSILLLADTVKGSGTLDARGGSGFWSGGGGRVALIAAQPSSGNTITALTPAGSGVVRGAAGTVYRKTGDAASLIVDNQDLVISSTNFYTELPGSYDLDRTGLNTATLVITNSAQVGLVSYVRMGDLYLATNKNDRLFLKSHTLFLGSYKHPDWGDDAFVEYDGGKIIWRGGTVLIVK